VPWICRNNGCPVGQADSQGARDQPVNDPRNLQPQARFPGKQLETRAVVKAIRTN